ncbi:hypothetical protein GFH30_08750 [Acinetobacter wanghuae]|uniref:DUF4238 domain-containing protein n=1 Tax=Acinetobacter wanghuae TaxID=2662362 RepID=A0A5Q0P2Z7_9GAMM|nr:hypothetical protein [Acinetobacter wanghuae]MQW91815.1 hypothetical protein [Acinetobacter wanghuae]QGA11475.1 hypothetical protein GFH30_08750 [Acinetobacter wanghuae]
MGLVDHEIVTLFREYVHSLSPKLVEMLNEHYLHQTERRGCGYTQATRVLAEYINLPRDPVEFHDLKLFDNIDVKALKKILDQQKINDLEIDSWRHLDQSYQITKFIGKASASDYKQHLVQWTQLQHNLRELKQHAALEESKLICEMIEDIILPKTFEETNLVQLATLHEKPKVGSCPMAENFFLKIAHHRILREGEINIFVDDQNRPIFLEKLNMGDNHSCISLRPVLMNGVRLPAGSLFSVDYDRDAIENKCPNKQYKGYVMPFDAISGFWFLRLTTLAISPQNRKRAFSTHFEQQVENGLYSPGTTQLQQLIDVAQSQIE